MSLYIGATAGKFNDAVAVEDLIKEKGYLVPRFSGVYIGPKYLADYLVKDVRDIDNFIKDLRQQIEDNKIDVTIHSFKPV